METHLGFCRVEIFRNAFTPNDMSGAVAGACGVIQDGRLTVHFNFLFVENLHC